MALALELKIGNAKVYVYDDLCKNIAPDEKARRDCKLRELMGRAAASPGAAERIAEGRAMMNKEQPFSYIWYPPYGDLGQINTD